MKINLKSKLLFLTIVPSLVIILLSLSEIRHEFVHIQKLEQTQRYIDDVKLTSWIVHKMQIERGVSTGFVAKDSPAEVSGMKVGDSIISIADKNYGCEGCLEPTDSSLTEINQSSDLSVATKKYQGREVVISVIRENENLLLNSKLLSSQEVEESALASEACLAQTQAVAEDCPSTKGYLGVIPTDSIARRSTWSAPIVAVVFSGQVIQETFSQFGHIIGDLFKGDTSTAKENVTLTPC